MTDTRYTITDLGILPGFAHVIAKALNDQGQIIGTLRRDLKSSHSFFWDRGQMHHVGRVSLNGINNRGQAVGTQYVHNVHSRKRFDAFWAVIYQNGLVTRLWDDETLVSRASTINDSGQVVGSVMTHLGRTKTLEEVKPEEVKHDGFVWQDGERRDLPLPQGYRTSEALAVNEQGVVVGTSKRTQPEYPMLEQAVLWDGEDTTLLGSLPGYEESKAVAINNRRQVLVQATCGSRQWGVSQEVERRASAGESPEAVAQYEAGNYWRLPQPFFVWENGHTREIAGRSASAINNRGQVVGSTGWYHNGVFDCDGRVWAFLWQDGDMADLNSLIPPDAGWELRYANDINNFGQIVGNGVHNGKERAFLLTPEAS